MATLTRQLFRIFLFFTAITAFAALSSLPLRAAPFAAYVMDARTGEELYSRNAETRLHPASLTKMMTLYIVFDAVERGEISLDTMVTVSKNAAAQPPSRLGLRAGQRIALRYLIRAAAVKSANDAATAIGDALSGSEARFAARMNRTAKAIGMTRSTFKNANGLTAAGHLSTARDMSVLGRRLFYDFPQYYQIFARRSTDAGVAEVANTNRRFLDAYKGADGIKTGYTVAAGFNLTASAERGSKRIIATVFGGTSTAQRNAKMAELLDLGFGEAPATARVQKPAPADLPAEAPDLLADSEGQPGSSGKTIRITTVMKTSPRPRGRPMAEVTVATADADADAAGAVVVALQSSIAEAVAAAAVPEAPAPFAIAAAADTATPERVALAPRPRPAGLAPPPVLAGAAVALPFATTAAVSALAEADRPDPAPAGAVPEAAVIEALAAAAASDPASPAMPDAAMPETAMPESAGPLPFTVVDAAPADGALPFAVISPEDLAGLDAGGAEVAALAPTPVLRPLPAPVAAPEPEVVTRLSTSGGRNWGVSLGQMPSRGAAERVLTRTTLTEGRALGDGLRKVVARGGGYDATVLGLTEEQAVLACSRLAARALDCTMIGP